MKPHSCLENSRKICYTCASLKMHSVKLTTWKDCHVLVVLIVMIRMMTPLQQHIASYGWMNRFTDEPTYGHILLSYCFVMKNRFVRVIVL